MLTVSSEIQWGMLGIELGLTTLRTNAVKDSSKYETAANPHVQSEPSPEFIYLGGRQNRAVRRLEAESIYT